MRKFLTDNFAKIGLVVLVLLTTALVTTIFISKIEFLAKADERINIFPANYSMESVGDTTWQNPQNIFDQDLAEDASLTEFNDDNSAFIQGVLYETTTTTESTVTTMVVSSELTTTTISAEAIPTTTIQGETTTTITEPTMTTTSVTTTATTLLPEITTTSSTVPVEPTTTTTLSPETTTTTTVPIAFIRNILSFLIPWAKAEETTTTVTETTTVTTTTTTVPVDVTTTETLPTATTSTTIEETITTLPMSTTTVPEETVTTTTIPAQITTITKPTSTTTTNTIQTEDKKDIILSSLIVSDFDLGEKSFDQMTTQNVQLRLSLASQGRADGKLIISYFYHSEWQNMGEIDLSQEVSNSKNGGYFLYALPVFENFQEFQNFKIKFQISGTQFQKVYLDAVWLEADFEEVEEELSEIEAPDTLLPLNALKERKLNRIISINKNADYSCEVNPFQTDISNLASVEVKMNLIRGRNRAIDEIEIGNLPLGIDLKFAGNLDYIYQSDKTENDITLLITKEESAQKGSFSIPIIYTKKDSNNSSVICQINIVNQ